MKDVGRRWKAELYEYLKQAILSLELPPGADLDEAALCRKFSLSRTPLREVVRRLACEGYVVIREHRGARVSEMSHTVLRDFFLIAPMIYRAVLNLAAENATLAQVEALKAAQEEFEAALRGGTAAERALANNRFHEITGEMAGNVFLLPSFNRLLIDHARIGMTFYRPQNSEMTKNLSEASRQHVEIISAIEDGNGAAAGRLAVEHWNLSRGMIEMFVMPSALDLSLGALQREAPA